MNNIEQLDVKMTQVVEQLIHKHEFAFPVHFALIASNGAFIVGEYVVGLEGKLEAHVVEHMTEPGALALPIVVLFADPSGKSQKASFEGGQQQALTVN